MARSVTRVGIAGLGFMGMVHYRTYRRLPEFKVVAVADRDPARRGGDWTGIRGNFGPPGALTDLSRVERFDSAEQMIANSDCELVDICLPPPSHEPAASAAFAAGKDVFSEKPLALEPTQCDRMISNSEDHRRRLLVGHVLPFFHEYAWAFREVQRGLHGRVTNAAFKRVTCKPDWLADYWDARAVGGPLIDLHVHDAHFIGLLFGEPDRVTTRGSEHAGLPKYWHSLLEFGADGPVVLVTGGVVDQPGRKFLHGFEIQMERAAIAFEFCVETTAEGIDRPHYTIPPTLYPADGPPVRVELGDGDPMGAFFAEFSNLSDVLHRGAPPGALEARHARDAIRLCHRQARSFARGSSA